MSGNPPICWGFGMTPVLRDKPHSILAIAWGPIIQLAVLIEQEDLKNPIVQDGYYIVHVLDSLIQSIPRPNISEMIFDEESKEIPEETDNEKIFRAFSLPDVAFIQAIEFISDSTLMIVLSGQEIRILDT